LAKDDKGIRSKFRVRPKNAEECFRGGLGFNLFAMRAEKQELKGVDPETGILTYKIGGETRISTSLGSQSLFPSNTSRFGRTCLANPVRSGNATY
jgi:hypothetical protein